jgi:hypothetical protein
MRTKYCNYYYYFLNLILCYRVNLKKTEKLFFVIFSKMQIIFEYHAALSHNVTPVCATTVLCYIFYCYFVSYQTIKILHLKRLKNSQYIVNSLCQNECAVLCVYSVCCTYNFVHEEEGIKWVNNQERTVPAYCR